MKKLFFLAVTFLFMGSVLASSPVYDVGNDYVKVIVDDVGDQGIVAIVDLGSMEVDQLNDQFKVTAQKVNHESGGYFLAIQTEIEDCRFLYCTNLIKEDLLTFKRTVPPPGTENLVVNMFGSGSGGIARTDKA